MHPSMKLLFYHSQKRTASDGRAPVILRITITGHKPAETSTGIRCKRSEWPVIQKAINRASIEEIELMKSRIITTRLDLIAKNQMVTPHKLLRILRGTPVSSKTIQEVYYEYYQEQKNKREQLAKSTIYRISVRFKAISEHIDTEAPINDLKRSGVVLFVRKLEQKYTSGYIVKLLQLLNAICNYALEYSYIEINPTQGVKAKKAKPLKIIQLSREQLSAIQNMPLSQYRLIKIRDTFLLMCYTGLSHCDLKKINASDWRNNLVVEINRQKSGTGAAVPVLSIAREILERHNGAPLQSLKTINSYLKELAFLAGIDIPLSTKIARKTFRRICRENGVPIEIAARMMGHSDIRTTQRYYDNVTASDVATVIHRSFSSVA
jgi:integrase/recombinase XerD